MERTDYDVIVVGAGFGGPVAAKACAEAGYSTLILERAATPGQKVISSCTIPFYGFIFGPRWIMDANPPIERPVSGIRNNFIKNGVTYKIDNSFRIPKWIWPNLAIGYTVYCRPFCTWLTDRAVEAGAKLRTSVTAMDVIKEGDAVKGVITDTGEELRCKILLDAEGLQNILAKKAGVRETFHPKTIELCLIYDFEIKKEVIDRVCGYNIEYFWSMPEEAMIAPLGTGSAVYIFPYRDSIHMTIGQFLKSDEGKVPAQKVLEDYYKKFFQTEYWKRYFAPHAKLRATIWDTCPIYAGLYEDQRTMPTFGDGILLIGDSAGLEASAIADGVPSAWFSAEIAAQCAIEALEAKDTSAAFLSRYDKRLRKHPLLTALITDPHRKDLAKAAASGGEADMRRRVNRGWGFRLMGRLFFPVTRAVLHSIFKNPLIIKRWFSMFRRYYRQYG